jgi:hypothetical protein
MGSAYRYRPLLAAVPLTVLTVALASAWQATGSIRHVLDYARGQRLFLADSTIVLGELSAGAPTTFEVPIRNASGSAVKILGVTTSCSCLQPLGLPATVAPKATHNVRFELTPGRRSADLELVATVITDATGQFQIPLVVRWAFKAVTPPPLEAAPSVLHSPASSERAHAPWDDAARSVAL